MGIGEELALPVLDGNVSINDNKIFLSDLEQTKGFEFDVVCVLNCNRGIMPNPLFPEDEWYRQICKFYVSMTRAKLSLIISYSSELSPLLDKSRAYFQEAEWKDHEPNREIEDFRMPSPLVLRQEKNESFLRMTGEEFLYTRKAVGISRELMEKLSILITGRSVSRNSRPTQWRNIGDALNERDVPAVAQLFGAQKTYKEFKQLFDAGNT
jgi:hypothetical protein